jgi:hypothetical protein
VIKVFFTIIFFTQSLFANELTCQRNSNLGAAQKQSCELISASEKCRNFYTYLDPQIKEKFQIKCPQTEEPSALSTVAACSGLVIAAGFTAAQKVSPEIATSLIAKTPFWVKKFGGKLVPFMGTAGVVLTAYSITDVILEGLTGEDKACFENIDKKKAILTFQNSNSQNILQAIDSQKSPVIKLDDAQRRSLTFPADYLRDEFAINLPCQQLSDIVRQQKRKQDQILGPLIASGKLEADPRKQQNVSPEEKHLLNFLLENVSCLSTEKQLETMCAVGNSVLGAFQLKKIVGDLKLAKPIPGYSKREIATVAKGVKKSSIKIQPAAPSYDKEALDQVRWKRPSEEEIESTLPGWAGDKVILHPDFAPRRVAKKEAYIRYRVHPADENIGEPYLKIEMLKGHPDSPGVGEYLKQKMIEENPGVAVYSTLAHRNAYEFKKAALELANNPSIMQDPSKVAEVLGRVPAIRSSRGSIVLNPIYNAKGDLQEMGVILKPDPSTNSISLENFDALVTEPKFQSWMNTLKMRPENYWNKRSPDFSPYE